MMMARPRTAGTGRPRTGNGARRPTTASRRHQRALTVIKAKQERRAAKAEAKANSRPQGQQVTSVSTLGARPQSARASVESTSVERTGQSMIIPKLLFAIFVALFIIGAIVVGINSSVSDKLSKGKIYGSVIIVISLGFLIASIVLCVCKKHHSAAGHDGDAHQGRGARGSSTHHSRYAMNHVEDETSCPPSSAWTQSQVHHPGSADSTKKTRDTEMTLSADRQSDMFGGTSNGGFLPDNHVLANITTPKIRITSEDDFQITPSAAAADMKDSGSNFDDINIIVDDDAKEKSPRPAGVPVLNLQGAFPSPGLSRRPSSSKNSKYDYPDEEAPPMETPSTVDFNTTDRSFTPSSIKPIDTRDKVNMQIKPQLSKGHSDNIEVKIINSDTVIPEKEKLCDNSGTALKGSALNIDKVAKSGRSSPKTNSAEAETAGNPNQHASPEVPSRSEAKAEVDSDLGEFNLGAMVSGGRGSVE